MVRRPLRTRHLAGVEIVGAHVGQQRRHAVEHADFHMPPFAGQLARVERGKNSGACIHARRQVAHGQSQPHRCAAWLSGDAHGAAHRLHHKIVA